MQVTYYDIKDLEIKTIVAKNVVVGAEWVTIFKNDTQSLLIQISELLCIMKDNL